jgi:hypothetical protein
VNVLGHTFVARAAGSADPEFLLGAVLPDLAPMAGIRLARGGIGGTLGDGVRCHVRTDEAFHGLPAVRAGMGELRADLTRRGLASGPARAVGHAGWELMLDGTLLAVPAADDFRRALGAGEAALAALDPADRPRWTAFLDRARRAPRPRYDDTRWVADRLHAMLARRPRLSLPLWQVPSVAAALARQVDAVRAAAPAVLTDTAAAVVAGSG